MNELKIIIRTCVQREEYWPYLSKKLPEAEMSVDFNSDSMGNFLSAMEMAGTEAVLHMEDDVVLADNFMEVVTREVEKRPLEVIQFFSMRGDDITTGSRYDRGGSFLASLCFYLPAGYSKKVKDYHKTWARLKEHPTGFDLLVADFLKDRKEKYWICVPNPIDHVKGKSVINPRRSSNRVSKTFKRGK